MQGGPPFSRGMHGSTGAIRTLYRGYSLVSIGLVLQKQENSPCTTLYLAHRERTLYLICCMLPLSSSHIFYNVLLQNRREWQAGYTDRACIEWILTVLATSPSYRW